MTFKTFEEYLKQNHTENTIDFFLRFLNDRDECIFYIHPANKDGETPYFRVDGNTLTFSFSADPDEIM